MKKLTILFAYRNRDLSRIKLSLESLENQKNQNFEVLFIDYGSDPEFSVPLEKLVQSFTFASYFYIAHSGLLWNKSKAFNFGIRRSSTSYIFTADIDLILHPDTTKVLEDLASDQSFTLFDYGYLPQHLTPEKIAEYSFDLLRPSHYGEINGVGLYPKSALEAIRGFDEFYHFYGSEDVDLFQRLENLGLECKREKRKLLLHQWHKRYPQKDEAKLTSVPRLANVLRINQQHYFKCCREKSITASGQEEWGICFQNQDLEKLENPTRKFEFSNLSSAVVHFLNESLKTYKGEIVSVHFKEDLDYLSLKNRLKKMIKRNYQPYLSIKVINDLILQKIIFYYRDHNYLYRIDPDLKGITFKIDLR